MIYQGVILLDFRISNQELTLICQPLKDYNNGDLIWSSNFEELVFTDKSSAVLFDFNCFQEERLKHKEIVEKENEQSITR